MNNYSPNHPAVRYQTEHNMAPTNRNTYIRRRRGTALMALSIVLLVVVLFGGWAWTGRHFGLVVFCFVPLLPVSLFIWAGDLIDTPLEKGLKK